MPDSASSASGTKRPAAGSRSVPHLFPAGLLALAILSADLLTKQVFWNGGRVIEVLPPFFCIVPRENTGGVFGLLAGQAGSNLVFVGVSVLAVAFITRLFVGCAARLGRLFALAVGLILGGAVGNLVDRLHYGFVRDFLEFSAGRYTWPTFNIADSAICVGTGLLAWRLWNAPAEEGA